MTNAEFNNEFDVLYNSITSNQAPGLDEYEKSVFLTKAQSEIIKEYFNSRLDGANGGFDGSQKRQYDFSLLTNTASLEPYEEATAIPKLNKDSIVFLFPQNYFLSINEVIQAGDQQYSVMNISYSDYQKLITKPYAFPPKRKAWRLFTNKVSNESATGYQALAEVIGKFIEGETPKLILRYIKTPDPIILVDLPDNLTIEDNSNKTPCRLPEQLHKEILERAVTLAKISYQGGSTSTLANQAKQN